MTLTHAVDEIADTSVVVEKDKHAVAANSQSGRCANDNELPPSGLKLQTKSSDSTVLEPEYSGGCGTWWNGPTARESGDTGDSLDSVFGTMKRGIAALFTRKEQSVVPENKKDHETQAVGYKSHDTSGVSSLANDDALTSEGQSVSNTSANSAEEPSLSNVFTPPALLVASRQQNTSSTSVHKRCASESSIVVQGTDLGNKVEDAFRNSDEAISTPGKRLEQVDANKDTMLETGGETGQQINPKGSGGISSPTEETIGVLGINDDAGMVTKTAESNDDDAVSSDAFTGRNERNRVADSERCSGTSSKDIAPDTEVCSSRFVEPTLSAARSVVLDSDNGPGKTEENDSECHALLLALNSGDASTPMTLERTKAASVELQDRSMSAVSGISLNSCDESRRLEDMNDTRDEDTSKGVTGSLHFDRINEVSTSTQERNRLSSKDQENDMEITNDSEINVATSNADEIGSEVFGGTPIDNSPVVTVTSIERNTADKNTAKPFSSEYAQSRGGDPNFSMVVADNMSRPFSSMSLGALDENASTPSDVVEPNESRLKELSNFNRIDTIVAATGEDQSSDNGSSSCQVQESENQAELSNTTKTIVTGEADTRTRSSSIAENGAKSFDKKKDTVVVNSTVQELLCKEKDSDDNPKSSVSSVGEGISDALEDTISGRMSTSAEPCDEMTSTSIRPAGQDVPTIEAADASIEILMSGHNKLSSNGNDDLHGFFGEGHIGLSGAEFTTDIVAENYLEGAFALGEGFLREVVHRNSMALLSLYHDSQLSPELIAEELKQFISSSIGYISLSSNPTSAEDDSDPITNSSLPNAGTGKEPESDKDSNENPLSLQGDELYTGGAEKVVSEPIANKMGGTAAAGISQRRSKSLAQALGLRSARHSTERSTGKVSVHQIKDAPSRGKPRGTLYTSASSSPSLETKPSSQSHERAPKINAISRFTRWSGRKRRPTSVTMISDFSNDDRTCPDPSRSLTLGPLAEKNADMSTSVLPSIEVQLTTSVAKKTPKKKNRIARLIRRSRRKRQVSSFNVNQAQAKKQRTRMHAPDEETLPSVEVELTSPTGKTKSKTYGKSRPIIRRSNRKS